MNTQLVAKEVKLSQWNALVQDCLGSGLKVKDWCEQNNINKDTYYYWLRKIREAACATMESKFVRIPDQYVAPSISIQSNFSTELTITVGSVTINVNSSTPQHLIETTVRALSNAK